MDSLGSILYIYYIYILYILLVCYITLIAFNINTSLFYRAKISKML